MSCRLPHNDQIISSRHNICTCLYYTRASAIFWRSSHEVIVSAMCSSLARLGYNTHLGFFRFSSTQSFSYSYKAMYLPFLRGPNSQFKWCRRNTWLQVYDSWCYILQKLGGLIESLGSSVNCILCPIIFMRGGRGGKKLKGHLDS